MNEKLIEVNLNAASLTKADIQKRAEVAVKNLAGGDALETYIAVKKAKAGLEIMEGKLHDKALEQARKHGKTHKLENTTLETRDTGVKWDYSNCNDPELVRLQAEFDKAKKALEKRQKFLQTLDKPLTTVNEEDGDVEPIYPAVRKATEKLFVSY